MIKIGILGGAGYTAGELIRLLINHPEAELKFINSESNAGNLVSDVHGGLLGECNMTFTSSMPFDDVDVVFFCFGHGKSEQFLQEHTIPEHVRIIDLAQDFRLKGDHDYVYGLPELNREAIRQARHVANPGCFATCIQCHHGLHRCWPAPTGHHSFLVAHGQHEHLQAFPAPACAGNLPVAQSVAAARLPHPAAHRLARRPKHRLYPLSRRLRPRHLRHGCRPSATAFFDRCIFFVPST